MRVTILSLILLMLSSFLVGRASSDFRITSGVISASDNESAECYFPIGQESSVNFKPGSVPCLRMRDLNGKKVDMWFTVIE